MQFGEKIIKYEIKLCCLVGGIKLLGIQIYFCDEDSQAAAEWSKHRGMVEEQAILGDRRGCLRTSSPSCKGC